MLPDARATIISSLPIDFQKDLFKSAGVFCFVSSVGRSVGHGAIANAIALASTHNHNHPRNGQSVCGFYYLVNVPDEHYHHQRWQEHEQQKNTQSVGGMKMVGSRQTGMMVFFISFLLRIINPKRTLVRILG